mmetsp:Transcript_24039/g.34922  ORF Transcript_24039/g.34922 Transcript_24039/m.34922 type:complete len:240 (-) Transcript_24039:253-972(-)
MPYVLAFCAASLERLRTHTRPEHRSFPSNSWVLGSNSFTRSVFPLNVYWVSFHGGDRKLKIKFEASCPGGFSTLQPALIPLSPSGLLHSVCSPERTGPPKIIPSGLKNIALNSLALLSSSPGSYSCHPPMQSRGCPSEKFAAFTSGDPLWYCCSKVPGPMMPLPNALLVDPGFCLSDCRPFSIASLLASSDRDIVGNNGPIGSGDWSSFGGKRGAMGSSPSPSSSWLFASGLLLQTAPV